MKKMKKIKHLIAILLIAAFLPVTAFAGSTEGRFLLEAGQESSLSFGFLDGDCKNITLEITGKKNCGILGTLTPEILRGKSTLTLFVRCCPLTAGTAEFTMTVRYRLSGKDSTFTRHAVIEVGDPAPEQLSGTWNVSVSPAFTAGTRLSSLKASTKNKHVTVSETVFSVNGAAKKSSYTLKAGDTVEAEITLTADMNYVFAGAGSQKARVNSVSADIASCSSRKLVMSAVFRVKKQMPVLTKSPTDETVEEGGSCNFIARADNADSVDWYLTDGSDAIPLNRARRYFAGLAYSLSDDEEKLKLSRIPYELNGWSVYAVFVNDYGEVESDWAEITVERPAPEFTPGLYSPAKVLFDGTVSFPAGEWFSEIPLLLFYEDGTGIETLGADTAAFTWKLSRTGRLTLTAGRDSYVLRLERGSLLYEKDGMTVVIETVVPGKTGFLIPEAKPADSLLPARVYAVLRYLFGL